MNNSDYRDARPPSPLDHFLKGLVLALCFAFVSLIVYDSWDTTPKVGGASPEFSLVTDQNRKVTPTEFGGKLLVLNFWASWCTPCVQETPSLNEFARSFKNKGVVVVGVSQDRDAQAYRRFLGTFRIGFDTCRQPDIGIQTSFGTFKIPETYILQNGRIVRKYIGEQDWMSGEMINLVQSLLRNSVS